MPRTAERVRDVDDDCASIGWYVPPQPVQVVVERRTTRCDHELRLIETSDGHVCGDPTPVVEPLRVHDPATGPVDLRRADHVQSGARVRTGHEDLPERRFIDQADVRADHPVLFGRVREPVLAGVAVLVSRLDAGRRVPVGSLPAHELSEARTSGRETIVEGRLPGAAGGLHLAEWPVRRIEQADRLLDPVVQVSAVPLEGREPPDVHLPQVLLRVTVDDPVRQSPPRPGAAPQAMRVEPRGHPVAR